MEQKQINDRIDDIVDNAGDGLCCSHAACHKMHDTSPFSILRPRNFSFGKESDPSPRCNAHSERERRPQCPGEQTSRAHLLCFLFLAGHQRRSTPRLCPSPGSHPQPVIQRMLMCSCSHVFAARLFPSPLLLNFAAVQVLLRNAIKTSHFLAR